MKSSLFIFLSFLFVLSSKSADFNSVDSIRVVGSNYLIEDVDFSKRSIWEFVDNWESVKKDSDRIEIRAWKPVDVTITNPKEIDSLLYFISNLQIKDTLSHNTNQIIYEGSYSYERNRIVWVNQHELWYHLLLILFSGKDTEFIWIDDGHYVEKGYYRYNMSMDLKRALSKYTHLFDAWLLYQFNNAEKVEINGIYYELNEETKEARVVSGDTNYRGDIEVPPTIMHQGKTYVVSAVSDFVFSSDSITSIQLPSTVVSIGEYVCAGCFDLTSMVIPPEVKEIPDWAFSNCVSLTSIDIPDGMTSIGESAFIFCEKLASIRIPNSMVTIGREAFDGCESLTSMTIPSSVKEINERGICRSLDTIMVDVGNPVYDSRGNCNAIIETSTNRLITGCRNTVIPDDVTSIGKSAFFKCDSLMSITIPESVTSIDEHAFHGCGISSVIIPSNVDSIGDYAFNRCSKLATITLPAGISSIGSGAFMNCESLKEVYCFAEKAPLIVPRVFEGTPIEKATLYVPEASIEEYKSAETWNKFKEIVSLGLGPQ